MDRNSIIGLVLIGVILIGFQWYSTYTAEKSYEVKIALADSLYEAGQLNSARAEYDKARQLMPANPYPKQRLYDIDLVMNPPKEANQITDSTVTASKSDSTQLVIVPDSLVTAKSVAQFGAFAGAADGTEKFQTIDNGKVRITFSNKGGRPYRVQLPEYMAYDSSALVLMDGPDNVFKIDFYSNNLAISTDQLFFVSDDTTSFIDAKEKDVTLKYRLMAGNNKYMEFAYTFHPNSYLIDFHVNTVGLNDVITNNYKVLPLTWEIDIPGHELGRKWETDNTSVYYKFHQDDVDYLSKAKDEDREELRSRMQWVAFKQQFFSSALIANQFFEEANISYVRNEVHPRNIMHVHADVSLPYTGKPEENIPMTFYFGPNKYGMLADLSDEMDKKYEQDFELQGLVQLGWGIFGYTNRFLIIPIFNWLGSFISNYGLLILVLTLIIRLILFPLTYKSYLSSARMRVLKPEVEEINKKIPKEKAMERQQAVMAMYRKAGVNPMGGCIPILLQMPILIAMFQFFPVSIELRQQAFLWATDLSTYDSILELPFSIPFYGSHVSLFTLLMAGSIILSTKMNVDQMGDSTTQMPGMKTMMYLMPVMMVFWFNSYSSGLSYYYFLSTIIGIIQTVLIRRTINDQEILAKIHANKKKPVTKSRFQERLEEMAKKRGYKLPDNTTKKK